MKNASSIKNRLPHVSWHIHNQRIKIHQDPDFSKIWYKFRKHLYNSSPNPKIIAECKKAIREYLKERKLPANWEIPLCNELLYEEPDSPLENGIELFVGSEPITQKHYEKLRIRKSQVKQISDEKKISIVITSKMSIERIIQFITDFREEILEYQKLLGLPKFYSSNWKQAQLARRIIYLKDRKGKPFSEIASELSKDEWLDEKELEYRSNENNIKSLYYDYKKYFKMK